MALFGGMGTVKAEHVYMTGRSVGTRIFSRRGQDYLGEPIGDNYENIETKDDSVDKLFVGDGVEGIDLMSDVGCGQDEE
ncbi:hypothetical protein GH714_016516 [Hevea brasiliensis]|uniref:Uncharacterized protein n=1 Tax=Hevea brasiliensis TaxID=3981 RepID=A0A6A6L9P8_HEVBR|nr:hypothetical protein GH714_016516 [Hevea brasiliensis]